MGDLIGWLMLAAFGVASGFAGWQVRSYVYERAEDRREEAELPAPDGEGTP